MRTLLPAFLLSCCLLQAASLRIYFVDVEGGGATLIVSPTGDSLLVDTGSATPDDRDAKRIADAAKAAGLTKLHYVAITHFDSDHSGGAPALAKLIPIDTFLDHGDSIETTAPRDLNRWKAYVAAAEGKRRSVKAGERIELGGVQLTVVSSNGAVLAKAMNHGKANTALCENPQTKDPDKTENALSLGFLLSYGKFTFVDLGDLTWDKELLLACPVNKLGHIALYQATMHGFYDDRSGPPAQLNAIQPQVIIVNNGPKKGLKAPAYERIAATKGVEDVWQGHLSVVNDAAHNTAPDKIANLEPSSDANVLEVQASKDGKFTVTNLRNKFSKTYKAH